MDSIETPYREHSIHVDQAASTTPYRILDDEKMRWWDGHDENMRPCFVAMEHPWPEAIRIQQKLMAMGISTESPILEPKDPIYAGQDIYRLEVHGRLNRAILESGLDRQGWAKMFVSRCRTEDPYALDAHKTGDQPRDPKHRNHLLHKALETLGIEFKHEKTASGDVYRLDDANREKLDEVLAKDKPVPSVTDGQIFSSLAPPSPDRPR